MSYEYGSESKLLELPNPYQLQNRLLWLCGALLVIAGVVSLLWAKGAMEGSDFRLAAAPLVAGVLLLAGGLAAAASAATRLRFFFGRGRPASLAPEIAAGASGGSPTANYAYSARTGALQRRLPTLSDVLANIARTPAP